MHASKYEPTKAGRDKQGEKKFRAKSRGGCRARLVLAHLDYGVARLRSLSNRAENAARLGSLVARASLLRTTRNQHFAECEILCRVQNIGHSANTNTR
jgi:hypothetical protein